MTKREAREHFIELWGAENIRYNKLHDKPALREAWNNYVDGLHRERRITDKQVQTWLNPFFRAKNQ